MKGYFPHVKNEEDYESDAQVVSWCHWYEVGFLGNLLVVVVIRNANTWNLWKNQQIQV